MFFAWVVSWKCHFPIKQKISQNYQNTYSNALSITREVLGKYHLTSTLRGQNTFGWKHPPITDSVTPDPVGFFPSLSKNLASPVPGENLILPGQFVASPVWLKHTQHVSFVYVWKRQTATWQKRATGGKFALPVAFFPKTRWGYICEDIYVIEGCLKYTQCFVTTTSQLTFWLNVRWEDFLNHPRLILPLSDLRGDC